MSFEVGDLESSDGVVGADKEECVAGAARLDGRGLRRARERGGEGVREASRSGPEDWVGHA